MVHRWHFVLLWSLIVTMTCGLPTSESRAANISINDAVIPLGQATYEVSLFITPSSPGELISGMNISFSAGELADAIGIIDTDPSRPSIGTPEEFDGSIWDPGYFGASGTPSNYSVLSTVSEIVAPFAVVPNGIAITYTLDTSGLPAGTYALNPNYIDAVSGIGTSAFVSDALGNISLVELTFDVGELTVRNGVAAVPEPSTMLMSLVGMIVLSGVPVLRAVRAFRLPADRRSQHPAVGCT
jgi:hypothetical protein